MGLSQHQPDGRAQCEAHRFGTHRQGRNTCLHSYHLLS